MRAEEKGHNLWAPNLLGGCFAEPVLGARRAPASDAGLAVSLHPEGVSFSTLSQ